MFVAKERFGVWRPNSSCAWFAATHAEIVWGGVTTTWYNASHGFVVVFTLILAALRKYANGDLNFHKEHLSPSGMPGERWNFLLARKSRVKGSASRVRPPHSCCELKHFDAESGAGFVKMNS
jgi:hypothetical protein